MLFFFFVCYSLFFFSFLASLSLLALKHKRQAGVVASFGVFNLLLIAPLFLGSGTKEAHAAEATSIRAMSINLLSKNKQAEAVRQAVHDAQPQIVVFQEVNSWWQAQLEKDLAVDYPYIETRPREDNFGISIFSKLPWSAFEVIDLGGKIPSLLTTFDNSGNPFHVLAVHFVPPSRGALARRRDESFEQLPMAIADLPHDTLVIGDLNATPWSFPFRRLLVESELKDSSVGFGLQPTWPTFLKWMAIPIDHCLHTPGIRIVNREVGAEVGSDHWPLLVDFQL